MKTSNNKKKLIHMKIKKISNKANLLFKMMIFLKQSQDAI